MRLMSAALMLTLAACAPTPAAPASEPAPEPAPPAAAEVAEPAPAPPEVGAITGGYAPASVEDEMVKAALAVATDAIYKRDPTRALVEKVEAEQQVVAGMNYHFVITMTGGARYGVTVYRKLDSTMEVTNYAKLP